MCTSFVFGVTTSECDQHRVWGMNTQSEDDFGSEIVHRLSGTKFIQSNELVLTGNAPVGKGSFGVVFRGIWRLKDVAIKVLHFRTIQHLVVTSDPPTDPALSLYAHRKLMLLYNEANMLSQLRHRNVVRFMGVCLDPPCIITEYCENGSLFDFIGRARKSKRSSAKFTWEAKIKIALGVANGMMCLHNRDPVVLHADLKSPNLLVGRNYEVKVADFGTSRFINPDLNIENESAQNPCWLAPEILNYDPNTKAADVYPMGIIMWELMTLRRPFETATGCTPPPESVFSDVLYASKRPEIPEDLRTLPGGLSPITTDYIQLMRRCWHQEPSERPTYTEIAQELRKMMHRIRRPPLAEEPASIETDNSSSSLQISPFQTKEAQTLPERLTNVLKPKQSASEPMLEPSAEAPIPEPSTNVPILEYLTDLEGGTSVPPQGYSVGRKRADSLDRANSARLIDQVVVDKGILRAWKKNTPPSKKALAQAVTGTLGVVGTVAMSVVRLFRKKGPKHTQENKRENIPGRSPEHSTRLPPAERSNIHFEQHLPLAAQQSYGPRSRPLPADVELSSSSAGSVQCFPLQQSLSPREAASVSVSNALPSFSTIAMDQPESNLIREISDAIALAEEAASPEGSECGACLDTTDEGAMSTDNTQNEDIAAGEAGNSKKYYQGNRPATPEIDSARLQHSQQFVSILTRCTSVKLTGLRVINNHPPTTELWSQMRSYILKESVVTELRDINEWDEIIQFATRHSSVPESNEWEWFTDIFFSTADREFRANYHWPFLMDFMVHDA